MTDVDDMTVATTWYFLETFRPNMNDAQVERKPKFGNR